MNETAQKILSLMSREKKFPKKLREIGRIIGVDHPQKVKYHLQKLCDQGLLLLKDNEIIFQEAESEAPTVSLVSLPIYGSANCGPATLFADDAVEGDLKVSQSFLRFKSQGNVIVLRADGNSMNEASINGVSIAHGDYVLVDTSEKVAQNGDYIVAFIEGCANIKRFYRESEGGQVHLVSESTEHHGPIILGEEDNFFVVGKVFEVIKQQGSQAW